MRVVSLTDDQHALMLRVLHTACCTAAAEHQQTEMVETRQLHNYLMQAPTVGDEQDPILLSIAAVDRLLSQAQEIIKERLTAP